jgi:hypothetical protein
MSVNQRILHCFYAFIPSLDNAIKVIIGSIALNACIPKLLGYT